MGLSPFSLSENLLPSRTETRGHAWVLQPLPLSLVASLAKLLAWCDSNSIAMVKAHTHDRMDTYYTHLT